MIALPILLLIFISGIVGFKAGQLWEAEKRESSRANHPSVTVNPPGIVDGGTIYFNYIKNQEPMYWQEKG